MFVQQSIHPRTQSQATRGAAISFGKVLVATDFSETSGRALEYALSLARTYGSRIFLTHVIPVDLLMDPELAAASRDELHQAARREMDRIESSGCFFGVAHEEIIEEGPLWPSLERIIQQKGIDLVVVGTHGKGPARKPLLGSSAEEIFGHAQVPVLTVGPRVEKEPLYGVELKNILFVIEFGAGTEREAAYAFALAQEHCSKINLMHVEARNEDPELIIRRLKDLVPPDRDLHCLPLFRIEQGDPVSEILRVADQIHADLIVLGSKASLAAAENGPHAKAYQVVCGAGCPVLTIKS